MPTSFATIRWQTYIIFGVFNAAMLIHVFFLFPETAGKTLEEVELMFEDPKGIPYIGTPAWKTKVEYGTATARERGDLTMRKLHGDESDDAERKESVEPKATDV